MEIEYRKAEVADAELLINIYNSSMLFQNFKTEELEHMQLNL